MQPAVVKTEDRKHREGPLVKTPDSLNLVQRRLTVTRKRKSAQGDAIDTRVPASGLGES